MSEPLVLRISLSPESLRKLNRGETVRWAGVAHPQLTIELAPIDGAGVPTEPSPRQIQEAVRG